MNSMNRVEKARIYAAAGHAAVGQKRKYSGNDYIEHPREVYETVLAAGGDEAQLCASWLHDLIEDTAITVEMIEAEFG